jgi:electron transport complex protein RnfB
MADGLTGTADAGPDAGAEGVPHLGATRPDRIEAHLRNGKWKNVPLRIEMSECINCDTCIRHCPPQFGAIFNHGVDVIIIPELCSGCGKCLPPVCPVDCIYPDPDWTAAPDEWWGARDVDDPYA